MNTDSETPGLTNKAQRMTSQESETRIAVRINMTGCNGPLMNSTLYLSQRIGIT